MKQRTAVRLAWSLGAVTIATILAGVVLLIITPRHRFPAFVGTAPIDIFDHLTILFLPLIGALVASRRSDIILGWLFLVAGIGIAVANFGQVYAAYGLVVEPGSLPAVHFVGWLSIWTWSLGVGSLPLLFLLFPTGELHSPRWRPVLWTALTAYGLLILVSIVAASYLWPTPFAVESEWAGPKWLEPLFVGAIFAASGLSPVALVSTLLRFRKAAGEERQQLKWVAVGAVLFVSVLVADLFVESVVVTALFPVASVVLFGAIGVAILRYRLYDVDLVINKGVVFAALAAFFTAVYVAVVVGIGALVGSRANTLLTVIAAVLIAVAFQPVRERARHLANRLVYGRRATPYEVLSHFSERMTAAYATEDLPARMARILREGTGATRAVVWLEDGGRLVPAASWPSGSDGLDAIRLQGGDLPTSFGKEPFFPVRHQDDLLGALSVEKPPNDPLTPAEEKLIADLASQAGLVLRNVRLIGQLRSSRQRLVKAQDEERRRLERNIHDGAQQQLVSLAVKVRLARQFSASDPAKGNELLEQVEAEVAEALDDLRDLARGIYPPLLADQGLVAALRAQARKSAVPVRIESDGLGRYPQEAEAAVYFCALEALQNTGKYAEATQATIRLHEEAGAIAFEVADDGVGFDPAARGYGTGLQGMADRLSALGGDLSVDSAPGRGTIVRGTVPAAPS